MVGLLDHTVLSSSLLGLRVSAKVLLELAEGSSVAVATKLFVDAGLASHLTGSEALTMLAPLDEAFRGESGSRSGPASGDGAV